MENLAVERRKKDDDDDVVVGSSGSGSDRISQLPESVLHHILCFLSQKKAVQTCVLSKSWRHLGPTRPVIHLRGDCRCHFLHILCENCFYGKNKAFLSVLEMTFQRYHDRNLFPQELRLEMLCLDSQSISVLHKWIPIFVKPTTRVTMFRLSVDDHLFGFQKPDTWSTCLDLSAVFRAEYLRELYLKGCRLKDINSIVLRNLRKLYLFYVCIDCETLENMISGCPLVENVTLNHCMGLKTFNIIVYKNHFLKDFKFSCYRQPHEEKNIEHSVAIDIPSLQTIRIIGCSKWYNNHRNYFPHLKSLYLSHVKLSTESFDNFSCNFPGLEELKLLNCNGFEEIDLSSRSIKHLIIYSRSSIKNIAIEVPKIKYFELSSHYYNLPTTLSLTTTSREWKSHLNLNGCVYKSNDALPNFLKLIEMFKALSGSQISLSLSETMYSKRRNKLEWDFNDHPVVVEHLGLDICADSLAHFLNGLFRTFRPRYTNAVCVSGNNDEEVSKFLWKTLIHEREKTEYGWGHLEEVSIEASDEIGKVWHDVQWTCLPEWSKNQKIRFRLKWRD